MEFCPEGGRRIFSFLAAGSRPHFESLLRGASRPLPARPSSAGSSPEFLAAKQSSAHKARALQVSSIDRPARLSTKASLSTRPAARPKSGKHENAAVGSVCDPQAACGGAFDEQASKDSESDPGFRRI